MNLLVELGVNRLSIRVQTFNLGLRKMLGRRGGGKEVVKKLKTLISRQFEQPPIETAMDIFKNSVDSGE